MSRARTHTHTHCSQTHDHFRSVPDMTWWPICSFNVTAGSRDSVLVECRTRDGKVASSNLSRSGGRILFSRVYFVCWLLFGVRSTPVLPQWHVKDPGRSAKSASSRLHLNTHTPLTQRSRRVLTILLSRHCGNLSGTSSHTTCHGTVGHSLLSSLSHCGLIQL